LELGWQIEGAQKPVERWGMAQMRLCPLYDLST